MKANELRIGNLVQVGTEIVEVIWFDHEGAVCQTLDHKSQVDMPIEPIPLTEDILLKCGFEYDKFDGYWYMDKYWRYFFENGICFLGNFSHRLDYLHQLQNLYFALTGEEITIKL